LINHRLAEHRKNCTSIKQQLNSCMENQLQRARQYLGHQSQLLNNLSPLNVVQRGYSLTRNEKHHLINSVHQTDIGSKIDVQLRDGSLTATVTSVEPKHDH
jgi:exodeoxyribonuclease VII large subunit